MGKILLFFCFVLFVMIVTGQEENQQQLCSSLHQYCRQSTDCCRHLECLTYAAKCVRKSGLIIPGQDKRPESPLPQN